ncbi:hypothetical protein JQX08_05740 [Pseudomonas sp. UL073]|uniref:Uncharacterized protein n=1 Tax=Zestomonas insulae TaxID=2809017 RepID=A0ABS2IE47_9GAMM|nr:hypothetical protein [Pseudomonas insulae]MBM7060202.1 hypothetical protein [Pseudomonas insulae]
MQRDRNTRFESFSAREGEAADFDEQDDYRQPAGRKPGRQRSLTLQIALGIWLGGVALMVTWFLLNVLFASFAVKLIGDSFSPKIGALQPQTWQSDAAKHQPPQLIAAPRSRQG